MLKAFKTFWNYLKTALSVNEWVLVITSLILSAGIASSVLWFPTEKEETSLILITPTIIKNKQGRTVQPFHTVYYIAYEKNRSEEEKGEVQAILSEEVSLLHKLSDPNYDFYLDDAHPENGEITNLKKINESLGTDTWLEIHPYLYDLLTLAKEVTLNDVSAQLPKTFNMFMGRISDFWLAYLDADALNSIYYQEVDPAYLPLNETYLNSRQAFLPVSNDDIENTLLLDQREGKFYVKFNSLKGANPGQLTISLGAIAKGYANEVIEKKLLEKGLTHGFIYGGSSSITYLGNRLNNDPWMRNFVYNVQNDFAFGYNRPGALDISNSGAYEGFFIKVGEEYYLRHHIIDPLTGYPSQNQWEVTLFSSSLKGGILDALSTSFMILSREDGLTLRQKYLDEGEDLEVVWTHPTFSFTTRAYTGVNPSTNEEVTYYPVVAKIEKVDVYYTKKITPYLQKYSNINYFQVS